METSKEKQKKVLIIGAGHARLSAGIYAGQAGFEALVMEERRLL